MSRHLETATLRQILSIVLREMAGLAKDVRSLKQTEFELREALDDVRRSASRLSALLEKKKS